MSSGCTGEKPSRSRLALALLAILFPTYVSAAPLDFDGDGLSDRVRVEIEQNGSLRWRSLGDTAAQTLGLSGRAGDHLIAGNWQSPTEPVVGYVRLESDDNLTWTLGPGNNQQSATFGTGSQLVVSGGDFNGDGLVDAALVGVSGRKLRWQINSSLFNGGSSTSYTHGRRQDIAFYMNFNGLRDGAAILRQPAEGNFRVLVRDMVSGRVAKINRISRALKNYGRPSPLMDPGGRDVLLFSRKMGARTAAWVIDRRGKRIWRSSVSESVDTVVGDFLSEPGEEFAFGTSEGYQVVNPFSKVLVLLESPDGIAVDHVNVNAFREDDITLPPPQGTCYEEDPTDGAKVGFIWKPVSDTQFGAVVILPGKYLNKVTAVRSTTTAGATIRTLSFKGNANPDPDGKLRPHYIDRTMVGSQYRSQYRSIEIEVDLTNGACLRYPIDNPAQRVD